MFHDEYTQQEVERIRREIASDTIYTGMYYDREGKMIVALISRVSGIELVDGVMVRFHSETGPVLIVDPHTHETRRLNQEGLDEVHQSYFWACQQEDLMAKETAQGIEFYSAHMPSLKVVIVNGGFELFAKC